MPDINCRHDRLHEVVNVDPTGRTYKICRDCGGYVTVTNSIFFEKFKELKKDVTD